MLCEKQQEDLCKILKTPIKKPIKLDDIVKIALTDPESEIETTQTYKRALDCDMSDFACGFYEILYKDILKDKKILNNEQKLNNLMFAGDTMNSFNTIANEVPDAGESKELRTCCDKWPKYLKDYHRDYHCLANFWLIPMKLGRTLEPGSKACKKYQDYMDNFLKGIKLKWEKYYNNYSEYFSKFKDYEDFLEKHFLKDVYVDESGEICGFSPHKDPEKVDDAEKVITNMQKMIKKRAEAISKSQYAEELWKYFVSIGILKD